jgi:hypothetical protein
MNDLEINDFIQQYEKNSGLTFQKEFEEFNLGAVMYKRANRENEMPMSEWILGLSVDGTVEQADKTLKAAADRILTKEG